MFKNIVSRYTLYNSPALQGIQQKNNKQVHVFYGNAAYS